jgi:uncharacterized protein related to proFAR isomerase
VAVEIIPSIRLLKKYVIIDSEKALKINKALELIKKLEFITIYAVDIKGLLKYKPSFEAIKKLASIKSLWLECGAKTCEDCIDLIIAGAENIVIDLSTVSLKNLCSWSELTKNIIIKLEFNERCEIVSAEECAPHNIIDIIETAKSAQIQNLVIEQKNLTQDIIDTFADSNLKTYLWCSKSELARVSNWKLSGIVIPLSEVI